MEREYIVNRFHRMKNKQDLLILLNEIKADELGDKGYPFTMKQINFYCNPFSIPNSKRYHNFYIAKKSGEKRQISAPVNGLKSIQTYLNVMLQAIYEPSPYVMGFTPNRSVVDNAKVHIGQNYIYNLDIKDFFPSIPQARVWGRLKAKPFNLKQSLANVVAGLCCMKVVTEEYEKFILPQGAPTSPLLTNAICDRLDYKLSKLASHYGLKYSRYADDITFSSMHNVYQEGSKFMRELHEVIEEQGFTINEAKTRLQKKGSRQEVTGLIISDKVNVTRKYTEDIRNILYIWERHGLSVAYNLFYVHYKKEKGHVKKGEPVLENVISGKLDYLKMVKGEEDSTYQKLRTRYDALLGRSMNGATNDIKYLDSKFVGDFENSLKCEIQIKKSSKGKVFAFFMQGNKKTMVSVSKNISDAKKDGLQISWCENADKERFYLLHWPQTRKKEQNENTSSNELDVILDKLCNSDFDLSIL